MYGIYAQSEIFKPAVKRHYYSKIFDENFNVGFHPPSKDACNTCDIYKQAAGMVTDEMVTEKEAHVMTSVKWKLKAKMRRIKTRRRF